MGESGREREASFYARTLFLLSLSFRFLFFSLSFPRVDAREKERERERGRWNRGGGAVGGGCAIPCFCFFPSGSVSKKLKEESIRSCSLSFFSISFRTTNSTIFIMMCRSSSSFFNVSKTSWWGREKRQRERQDQISFLEPLSSFFFFIWGLSVHTHE